MQALQTMRALRLPTKQSFSLSLPLLVRSAFSRYSLFATLAYKVRPRSTRTQKAVHRGRFTSVTELYGKPKRLAVAAFLGDSGRYCEKAAGCCGKVTNAGAKPEKWSLQL